MTFDQSFIFKNQNNDRFWIRSEWMRLDIYLVIRQCFDLPPTSVTTSQICRKPALKWKCWPKNDDHGHWKAALFFGNWNVTKKRISFLIWDPEKSSHLKIRKVFQTNFLFPSNKILLRFKVFQRMKWQFHFYQRLIWSKTSRSILTLRILENSPRCNCIKCSGILGSSTQRFFLKSGIIYNSILSNYIKSEIWISPYWKYV